MYVGARFWVPTNPSIGAVAHFQEGVAKGGGHYPDTSLHPAHQPQHREQRSNGKGSHTQRSSLQHKALTQQSTRFRLCTNPPSPNQVSQLQQATHCVPPHHYPCQLYVDTTCTSGSSMGQTVTPHSLSDSRPPSGERPISRRQLLRARSIGRSTPHACRKCNSAVPPTCQMPTIACEQLCDSWK